MRGRGRLSELLGGLLPGSWRRGELRRSALLVPLQHLSRHGRTPMTLRNMDAAERRQLADLKALVKAMESPDKAIRAAARKQASRDRQKAIGKPAKGQREPPQRDKGYLAWLRRLACVAGAVQRGCIGPTEAAHLRFSDAGRGRNSGMQRKPDDKWATPLCRWHHQNDQHAGSEQAFWARLGIDPGDLCEALYAAYQAGRDGSAVIAAFIPRPFQRRGEL